MPSVGHAKRIQAWKRRYGITEADYLKMLAAQGGACSVCKTAPPESELLHVDHDHMTGQVRSLLCKGCNTALGNIQDDPEKAAKLAEYLKTHQPPPELTPPPLGALAIAPKERKIPQKGKAYLTDKELKDARIPRPELLVAMEQAGMDKKQISEELGISLKTTKAILSDKERIGILAYARDYLLRDVFATAIAKVKLGVETDNKGEFSLELLGKMGVFPKEQKELAPVEEGFEEWRMKVTRRVAPDTAIEAEVIHGESRSEGETRLLPVSSSVYGESGPDSRRE
jgi:hypothetical protein